MRENGQTAHDQHATPNVKRIITVFTSVGNAQEHISRFERAPDVIAHRV